VRRAFILVLDSLGVGASADAGSYGDTGADTLGHIAAACAAGDCDVDGLRSGPLRLPNLARCGLTDAAAASRGAPLDGIAPGLAERGAWGHAAERSLGKDTPSGHWEIAGVPVPFDWGYFPQTVPCFPDALVDELVRRCDLPGILGNRHASGTTIIAELGEEHLATGKPICYTSADSVFQIAAHEEAFGLERLMEVCTVAKELVDPLNIARVIARPFLGSRSDDFVRTGNRRDLTTPPPGETLLDRLAADGGEVVSVGKVADIFAHRGVTRSVKASGNMAIFDTFLAEIDRAGDRALVFGNLVDFDMLFGHRRNVAGYAAALEALDARWPELERRLRPGDLLLVTADHGCDPTWPGTDHTREHVPMLFAGPGVPDGPLGGSDTFADMGATLAAHLGLAPLESGRSRFRVAD